MTMTTRRGFTLVELLIGLVLMLVVGGVLYKVLVSMQRTQRMQMEQSLMQENVRAGGMIVPTEFKEIGYDSNQLVAAGPAAVTSDLISIGANSIRFRAMRGVGLTCAIAVNEIRILKNVVFKYRDITTADSLLLFVERDPNLAADDDWQPLGISAVDLNSTCGADQAIRFTLTTNLPAGLTLSQVALGGPVRFFQDLEFGLYTNSGRSWLGSRTDANAGYQPVIGPLADDSGFALTYYDKSGNVTATRTSVRTIGITIRGRSAQGVSPGTGASQITNLDLTTRVALRNNLRP